MIWLLLTTKEKYFLLINNLLQISLTGAGDIGEIEVDNAADNDTAEQEGKDIYSGKVPDNVLDLTEKLKNKEDNEKEWNVSR